MKKLKNFFYNLLKTIVVDQQQRRLDELKRRAKRISEIEL